MAELIEDNSIGQYLKEGLLAIVPVYQNKETGTIIYTLQGIHEDLRSVNWMVKMAAAHFCLELSRLRRYYGSLLGLRYNISIPLEAGLVLLPVKMRQAENQGEVTIGYINLMQVQDILPPLQDFSLADETEKMKETKAQANNNKENGQTGQAARPYRGPQSQPDSGEQWLSRVLFKNGLQLKTLNTPETLEKRLRQGKLARRNFLHRRSSALYTGLCLEDIMNLLPPCECALKEFFIRYFTKGG